MPSMRYLLCVMSLSLSETQRVIPDWRQIPGDVNWFTGCGLGNREIRGPIAAGLEQNKVRKHVAVCLSHCGPPSCTLKDAETDCACLRCTMFCMSRGSYVDACLNNHTRDLCLDYQKYINSTELCEVDCDAAAGLPFSVFLTFGLLCSSFLFA
ncbi:Uncharacterized protein SCF082_LOCUS31959 [Durusdinium trenchii]|uniref:Uncharacterized protein n=1 Tax=Durusdinium trenchii TaxID=1381693 RepID=A0ABP0NB12_9DINO